MTDPYAPPEAPVAAPRFPTGLPLASAGPRFLAALFDVCLMAGAAMVGGVGAHTIFDPTTAAAMAGNMAYLFGFGTFLSFCVMEGWPLGASPGKLAMDLRVVELDGSSVTFGRGILRAVAKGGVLVCCCWVLGFAILFELGSGPWDSVANTRVIRRSPDA